MISSHILNLRQVTPPSLLVPTKGMFYEYFHGIIVVWFWVFKYILGVLVINAWLWFFHILVMLLYALMVVLDN